jgi:predicted nucleotidyltransferase
VTTDELLRELRTALAGRSDLRFAVLFGSAVTRGPDLARDIDVAVSCSPPLALLERARLATELEVALGREVDVVDVEEASTLLRWEVVRYGRTILANDPEHLLQFKARVPIERADLEPYYARESAGLRRALEEPRWSASNSSVTRSGG